MPPCHEGKFPTPLDTNTCPDVPYPPETPAKNELVVLPLLSVICVPLRIAFDPTLQYVAPLSINIPPAIVFPETLACNVVAAISKVPATIFPVMED